MAHISSPTPSTSIDTTRILSPPNAFVGSFWSSSQVQESIVGEDNSGPNFDLATNNYSTSKQDQTKTSPLRDLNQRIPSVESLS